MLACERASSCTIAYMEIILIACGAILVVIAIGVCCSCSRAADQHELRLIESQLNLIESRADDERTGLVDYQQRRVEQQQLQLQLLMAEKQQQIVAQQHLLGEEISALQGQQGQTQAWPCNDNRPMQFTSS